MYSQYLSDRWWLQHWDWEWIGTFTFNRPISRGAAIDKLKKWLLRIQKGEHMQVAGWYCYVLKDKQTHIHIVLLGTNRDGKRLIDVDPERWVQAWGTARIAGGVNRSSIVRGLG